MPRRKEPLHVPIALGLSGGLYAVTLAAVTGLQAQSDTAFAAAQRPARDALAAVGAAQTSARDELNRTAAAFNEAASAYGAAARAVGGYGEAVGQLAARVGQASGAAAQAPARGLLPPAPASAAVSAPAVHATTGASGAP